MLRREILPVSRNKFIDHEKYCMARHPGEVTGLAGSPVPRWAFLRLVFLELWPVFLSGVAVARRT